MLERTGFCLLLGVVGAAPACGGPSEDNYGDPAAAGSAMKGGSSGSSGSKATGGASGASGAAGKGGTSSSTGGSAMGGSGGSTGGAGGTATGGTGMGGSATQGGSSGDGATGGTGMATGGTDPGTGGTDPGTGGTEPGTGGTNPGMGGTDPGMGGTGNATAGGAGGMAGKPGTGGSAGQPNCEELTKQYADALAEARACNAKSGKEQCTETVQSSLTCGCPVFVNPDNEEALAELKRLNKAGASCNLLCPAVLCVEPVSGECAPFDGSAGQCRSTGAILE